MPISPNEIKNRAYKFANDWKDETRERAEKDTFWNEFFNVFGIDRKRVAGFEHQAKRLGNKQGGFIDVFWPGLLLCEHKSQGKDLEKAFDQAVGYFEGLKDEELPRYIIVSDFQNIILKDLQTNKELPLKTEDFPKYLDSFKFMGGQTSAIHEDQEAVNIQAAELMGKIHDALFEVGYRGHELEIFLVRTLFILFAEDTNIFEKSIFTDYIINRTSEDGSDVGSKMEQIFETLNTPENKRFTNLDEDLARFKYVNGGLFAEHIRTPQFDSKMRQTLIQACKFDWSGISPAIFGSLFQYVMDKEKRRNFGAHYTEEKTILRTIKPLFLDNLYKEFNSIKRTKQKLADFHKKLGKLNFFDPACGCGNFLVITYREIRKLELEVIKILYKSEGDALDATLFCEVDVDQFFGIEIEEFPAKIAETALWLMDHIANSELSKELGQYFVRIPLKKQATIVNGNALKINWEEVLVGNYSPKNNLEGLENFVEVGENLHSPASGTTNHNTTGDYGIAPTNQTYIIGNPPFVGSKLQSAEQRNEMKQIFHGVQGAGGYGLCGGVVYQGWATDEQISTNRNCFCFHQFHFTR